MHQPSVALPQVAVVCSQLLLLSREEELASRFSLGEDRQVPLGSTCLGSDWGHLRSYKVNTVVFPTCRVPLLQPIHSQGPRGEG